MRARANAMSASAMWDAPPRKTAATRVPRRALNLPSPIEHHATQQHEWSATWRSLNACQMTRSRCTARCRRRSAPRRGNHMRIARPWRAGD